MAARTGDEAIGGGVSGGKPTEEASAQVIDGFAAFLGGDALIVPAGFDLLHADFARSGHDLVLTAPDGAQLVITDYFALPLQADLATADGAVLPAATVAALAGPQAPGQYAQAGANDAAGQQIIGEVKTIEGRVVITRADGTVIEAEIGTQIYAQDVVETTLSGGIGILFVDDTSFALGGNARMVMDKFVFDPATASNSGVLTVVQGAFSFVSGQVAKSGDDALTIETPTLTIGVRGTSVIGKAAAEGAETRVALVRDPDGTLGKIYVFNDMDAYLIE
ncbi:MAG: FecR family protein, partial [Alphaproteobacteria bacterium]